MVLNSLVVVTVARVSAEAWQRVACIGEPPVSSDQLLDLLFCFPFHQLGRLTLCVSSFFCLCSFYPFDSDSDSDFDSDSSSSSSTLHFDDFYYHSHSD